MTGAEHYREAEKHLKWSAEVISDEDAAGAAEWHQKQAQVHATLSLAAATALGREGEGRAQPSKDAAAWFDAAAECRKAVQS